MFNDVFGEIEHDGIAVCIVNEHITEVAYKDIAY